MNEFKLHDYFTGISDGYTSREVLNEHVRKTYDQIRELADHIDQMLEELTQQSEELEEKEIGRESAENVRVVNETERVSKDSVRDSKIEAVEVNLDSKANKQQEAWITPTMLSGATTDPDNQVGYMKDEMGFVHFKGRIKSAAGSRAFNVADGYRFSLEQGTPKRFAPVTNSARIVADVQINYVGAVYVAAPNNDSWVYLDGISYKAGD